MKGRVDHFDPIKQALLSYFIHFEKSMDAIKLDHNLVAGIHCFHRYLCLLKRQWLWFLSQIRKYWDETCFFPQCKGCDTSLHFKTLCTADKASTLLAFMSMNSEVFIVSFLGRHFQCLFPRNLGADSTMFARK